MTTCEPNPCGNGGKCEVATKSYHCSCKGGWKGKHCLEDINECTTGIGTLDLLIFNSLLSISFIH